MSIRESIDRIAEKAMEEWWSDNEYVDTVMDSFTMDDIYNGCDRVTYNWFYANEYRREMYGDDDDLF